jgi:hypothetical protein
MIATCAAFHLTTLPCFIDGFKFNETVNYFGTSQVAIQPDKHCIENEQTRPRAITRLFDSQSITEMALK